MPCYPYFSRSLPIIGAIFCIFLRLLLKIVKILGGGQFLEILTLVAVLAMRIEGRCDDIVVLEKRYLFYTTIVENMPF